MYVGYGLVSSQLIIPKKNLKYFAVHYFIVYFCNKILFGSEDVVADAVAD